MHKPWNNKSLCAWPLQNITPWSQTFQCADFSVCRLFRVQVFQGADLSGSAFSRMQIFLGSGFSVSGYRVWVLEVTNRFWPFPFRFSFISYLLKQLFSASVFQNTLLMEFFIKRCRQQFIKKGLHQMLFFYETWKSFS